VVQGKSKREAPVESRSARFPCSRGSGQGHRFASALFVTPNVGVVFPKWVRDGTDERKHG
jgi:hypothetical protein